MATTSPWHAPYFVERVSTWEGGWPLLTVVLLKREVHLSGALLGLPVMSQPGRGGNLPVGQLYPKVRVSYMVVVVGVTG